jgi:hypothetical protein
VWTCLIVVAVANATATPKAKTSAIKANFGPIKRPPISIATRPTYGQPGRRLKSGELGSRARSRFAPIYSSRPGQQMRQLQFKQLLTAKPAEPNIFELDGNRADGTELTHSRRIKRVPIQMVVILLLDLAIL